MTEHRTTSKFSLQVETETTADFWLQLGEQLSKIRGGGPRFHIKADTAADFLKQVGEQLPKITFDSIGMEEPWDGEGGVEGAEKYGQRANQRVDEYCAMVIDLACKLFCSAVITDWSDEDFDSSAFPPPEIRLIFAETLHQIKHNFRSFNNWGGSSPLSDDETRRVTQWYMAIHDYANLKGIYCQESESLTEQEAECLLNIARYELADKRDKNLEARLEEIDRESGRQDYFTEMLSRMEGFSEWPLDLLAILVTGQFRNVQDILQRPGRLVYIPVRNDRPQAIVLYEGDDRPGSEWFDADSLENALERLRTGEAK